MRYSLIVLLLLGVLGLNAQDSTLTQAQDSSLDASRVQQAKLLAMADSARVADSLEKLDLQRQLENLRSGDIKAKAKLQARLDSIASIKAERDSLNKARIDSLRASTKGVPVIFDVDTLFLIFTKLGPFTPTERAERIVDKLEKIADDALYDAELFELFENDNGYDVMYGDIIVLSVTTKDAFWLNMTPKAAAESHEEIVIAVVDKYRSSYSIYKTLLRIGMLLLVAAILFFLVKYLNKWFSRLIIRMARSSDKYMKGISLKDYEFLSPERQLQLVVWLLNAIKWLIILFVVYLALPVIFSIFPSTEGVARTLIGYVTTPLFGMIKSIVGFIPEMITIAVIITVARYIVRFMEFLKTEIESGKLVINGFYPDWSLPTFNLLKVLIYAFTFIVVFPYLPGSDSPIFQGVSVFLGLLISLGSSSAISNLVAGLVITYMRPFRIGERVKIGDVVGDVVEKTMLVTRLRTIKNEDISIPNANILSGSTINYSSSAANLGLILHTTVTIGYDVPWRDVHALLISAAEKCDNIEKEPKPFVLQTSLDDFYVSYQINAYTKAPASGSKTYSQLYANIQDAFNEGGVEILSPHYRAQRDGNTVTTPPHYLPKDYQPPSFNVKVKKDG